MRAAAAAAAAVAVGAGSGTGHPEAGAGWYRGPGPETGLGPLAASAPEGRIFYPGVFWGVLCSAEGEGERISIFNYYH